MAVHNRNGKCHFVSEQQLISSITRNRYCFNCYNGAAILVKYCRSVKGSQACMKVAGVLSPSRLSPSWFVAQVTCDW